MSEENKAIVPHRQGELQVLAGFDEMEKAAKWVAESGLFGITKPAQAMCLFLLCQSEGVNYIEAIRRYHLVDTKPAMRADYMQAKFQSSGGAIIWHIRTDEVCAATFFADKTTLNDESRTRAIGRFTCLWEMDACEDAIKATAYLAEIAKMSREGEETIFRTFDDAASKGLTTSFKKNDAGAWEEKQKTNWRQSPRQMLTARVITEGVRVIAPGLIAGVYAPDEVEDIITRERLEERDSVENVLRGTKAKDRVAIQAMIDQYVEDSKTANPAEKSRLLGLAADLRVKLAELDDKDEIPGISSPRTVDTEVFPLQPEGELNMTGESPPKKVPWQEYVLQYVKSKKLLGKRLGSFVADEITVIYEKTKYILDAVGGGVDPKVWAEAKYIEEAFDYYQAHMERMVEHGNGKGEKS